MKSKLLTAFFSLMLIAGSVTVSSFGTPETKTMPKNSLGSISSFRAHRQGQGVTLTWASNSSNVERFEVERSWDGEFFDCVANCEAIGSSKFKFNDAEVYPGLTYYRIAAVHSDGSTEYSATEVVRIVSKK